MHSCLHIKRWEAGWSKEQYDLKIFDEKWLNSSMWQTVDMTWGINANMPWLRYAIQKVLPFSETGHICEMETLSELRHMNHLHSDIKFLPN